MDDESVKGVLIGLLAVFGTLALMCWTYCGFEFIINGPTPYVTRSGTVGFVLSCVIGSLVFLLALVSAPENDADDEDSDAPDQDQEAT